MQERYYAILLSFVSAILLGLVSEKIFQIYQLSSYRIRGVFNWLKASKFDFLIRYFALAFFSTIAMLVFVACFSWSPLVEYIGFVFMIAFCVLFFFVARKQNKAPLKITARMVRLIIMSIILFFALSLGLIYLGFLTPFHFSLVGAAPLFVPFVVALAGLILLPIETFNNWGYKVRAMKTLNGQPALIKIGITGSFGKTTAKNMLAAMLQKKYNVCFSPSSYNTPMGLAKVINNSLNFSDDVFIAEMGARSVGDIKELACMIKPNYALITAIGNQHLETFGTLDNIKNTKFELVENMAVGGLAGFNGDNKIALELFNKATTAKFVTGGKEVPNASVWYKNVAFSKDGTTFTLVEGDSEVEITTKLLGRHIPSLIAVTAALSLNLGVSLEQIKEAVFELKPVSHRLEIIKNGDATIIDDAYNSNTEGAENALLVLKDFSGVKIVITPGLVELGEKEKQANTTFGMQIAESADYALLIGERGKDIALGAKNGGMKEDRIFCVNTLKDAVNKLKEIDGVKVVLFENDLPDNF